MDDTSTDAVADGYTYTPEQVARNARNAAALAPGGHLYYRPSSPPWERPGAVGAAYPASASRLAELAAWERAVAGRSEFPLDASGWPTAGVPGTADGPPMPPLTAEEIAGEMRCFESSTGLYECTDEELAEDNDAAFESFWQRSIDEYDGLETRDFGRFHLYTETQLGQFPAVEWFEGLEGYLPRRELVGLWGPGDSYKSFTALDWACHVAHSGEDVLYIAAEGASGLRGRIAAWKKMHRVDALHRLRVMPQPVRMQEPEDVKRFGRAVLEQGTRPVLVVVDTLARNFVGGNENSAQDMGLFVEGAEMVRRAFGCAVVVVHHATKDGTSERGGESLRNASFAMYRFDRIGKQRVRVVCERMKDAEQPVSVMLSPVVVELGVEESSLVALWPYGEDATPPLFEETDAGATKRLEMTAAIVEVVKAWGSGGDRLSQTQAVKRVKGTDGTIARLLKELALDPLSPVQSEKKGQTLAYFFEPPHTD
jgi:AAA domain